MRDDDDIGFGCGVEERADSAGSDRKDMSEACESFCAGRVGVLELDSDTCKEFRPVHAPFREDDGDGTSVERGAEPGDGATCFGAVVPRYEGGSDAAVEEVEAGVGEQLGHDHVADVIGPLFIQQCR